MIAIVDYGVGNLFSLESSLKKVGAETVVTSDRAVIERADKSLYHAKQENKGNYCLWED